MRSAALWLAVLASACGALLVLTDVSLFGGWPWVREGVCGADAAAWLSSARAASGDGKVLLTREQLRQFDGRVEGRPLLLCVLGECFDVSTGAQFYGPQESYSCFAGNDGSRAYVTGEFSAEGCHDDVADFTGQQMMGVEHWLNFYRNHHEYQQVGRLVGRYFDAEGRETRARVDALRRAAQQREDELNLNILPACNSIFQAATEHTPARNEVWCSSDSGGGERHWIGLPRLEQSESGRAPRCVCAPPGRQDEQGLSVYRECAPDAVRCELAK